MTAIGSSDFTEFVQKKFIKLLSILGYTAYYAGLLSGPGERFGLQPRASPPIKHKKGRTFFKAKNIDKNPADGETLNLSTCADTST